VPGVYFGEDLHSIDPKGRLNIPARHRRTAAEHGGQKLKVMPGFDDCLVILDAEGFRARSDRVNTLPESAEDARWFERELFMNTAEIEPDAQGRVVIPERLRKYAGLEREVLIIGANGRIELWNPERLAAYAASHRKPMAETAKGLVY
jgi:MraZ protein